MRTRFWKLAALVIAMAIALSGCSLIEIDQEMEMAEVVAVVGDTKITKGEVIDLYQYQLDYTAYIYQYYYGAEGLTADEVESVKDAVLDAYIERELTHQKLAELGLTDFSEESYAEADAEAEAYFEESVQSHADHVDTEGMTEEEAREAIVAHLESEGTTLDSLKENYRASYDYDLLYNYVAENITVSDEEIQASYDAKVAEDEATYSSSSYLFELYNTYGYTITWMPEGYRTVKHILFAMDDEQKAALNEINTRLSEIETELAAVASEEETEATDSTDDSTDESASEPVKTPEELNSEKAELEKELAAKKEEILASFKEQTDAIYERLDAGESFADLCVETNDDTGMLSDPSMTTGYYVCETSSSWDTAFRDAAMALEKVGDVSDPILGSNGVHIIYYNSDVIPGAVDIETVREELSEDLLSSKQEEAYDAQYEEWTKDANVKKYPKVLG